MTTRSNAESKRMYSWWWDSHISPKNSKWLQENLSDMDAKVKAMIKLIEEDADSFARRAEIYYQKRPELMKLVEEFYRAYRALAERYDQATGALRQAHRTMSEAFPNQVPLTLADDSPATSASETDPSTPEISRPIRSLFDLDASGLSSSEEPDSLSKRKGLRKFSCMFGSEDNAKSAEGRVRKGLNFHEAEEKELSFPESEVVGKFEKEIQTFKDAIDKLEAEKEAGLAHHQESLERLFNLQSEISCAQEDSIRLSERAIKAEDEVQAFREALTKLESEKEASLLQYQQCLERVANLEDILSHAKEDAAELNERAHAAETEAQALKEDLGRIESEKDDALDQRKQSLEMILTLENKLLLAEEDARKFSERAEKAESEVDTLKQALAKLTEEKEAAALRYQQCLETISSLEHKISCAKKEAQRLNEEIDSGVAKLKGAEERCLQLERSNQSLHSELESLVLKMGSQNEELTAKEEELGRLRTHIDEERLRFIEENAQLESSRSALSIELEGTRGKINALEESFQSLLEEKSALVDEKGTLITQSQATTENLEKLSEKNTFLENSLSDAHDELKGLRARSKSLEDSCQLLENEKSDLITEKDTFASHGEITRQKLEVIDKSYGELEEKFRNLSLIFQNVIHEKSAELEQLGEDIDKLHGINDALEDKLRTMEGKLEEVRLENLHLKESLKNSVDELRTVTSFSNQLNYEMANCKDLLSQKEIELSEAACKVTDTEKEIDLWEREATTFFGEQQISTVLLALLEEKFHELTEECLRLEDGISYKDIHVELLKERINTLEGENGALKAQLNVYTPAVICLKDCISSLENHTCLHSKLQKSHNEGAKDPELGTHDNVESCEVSSNQEVPDAFSELQDLVNRVKAVEKAVMEMERLATHENLNANAKLEEAMRWIQELRFKGGSNQEIVKPASQISELENGLLTKDIILDEISEDAKSHQVELVKKQKSKYHNSNIFVEKELGVDKLDISKTFSESFREVNKSKILQSLNSDVQKLTNLQITVQDLKRKVEITEKSKKSKAGVELDNLKRQLEEADEAILKLFDLNRKLMKSIENRSFSADSRSFSVDSKSSMESEESENVRRRISEQARRVSEKVGRLQLDVQKIRLGLLKLDGANEKGSKAKTKIRERKRRVTLRDYFYGGGRTSHRRKMPAFCGCVETSASRD